jgi:hypothetical protein
MSFVSGLDTEATEINKYDISSSNFTGNNTSLDGSMVGNGLVWIDALGRLLAAKVLFKELLNLGDIGETTNEDDPIILDVRIHENTDFMVFLKRPMLGSSNLAWVGVSEKSLPSSKDDDSLRCRELSDYLTNLEDEFFGQTCFIVVIVNEFVATANNIRMRRKDAWWAY